MSPYIMKIPYLDEKDLEKKSMKYIPKLPVWQIPKIVFLKPILQILLLGLGFEKYKILQQNVLYYTFS